MALPTRVYTPAEKTKRARLLLKGAKGAYGDTSRIEARIDRIDQAAEERGRREAAAHARQLEEAKNTLAAARVAERCATGRDERAAARQARKDAEKRLHVVERAGR